MAIDKARAESRGSLIAAVLTQAWRQHPKPLEIALDDLTEVAPLLLGSGAGALGWWRIRNSESRTSPAAFQLQQAYRLHTLQAAIHEREIRQVVTLFRAAGIEPLLIKGWAIARLYPEKGLRPYDDIDIVVRPDQYLAAEAMVRSLDDNQFYVDLHKGFAALCEKGEDDLYARSQLVRLGDVDVRVLRLEDHFRVLCLHLLSHGAFRPLWLCDIAMALESRPAGFDWKLCLGGNKRQADWIACTIGLAHQLLGAEVGDTPVAHRARHLPKWLVPSVLKQWATPLSKHHGAAKHQAPMISYIRHPAGMLNDLRNRWPDPIAATVNMGGEFDESPRLLFQLGNCLSRTLRFVAHLPRLIREQQ
jgi:Uncharacterised nucleotidyltransferase